MKITRVTPWLIRTPWPWLDTAGETPRDGEYLFVQVDTDDGLTGWGEITVSTPRANRLAAAAMAEAGALVLGADASRIEALWQRVFREFTYLGTRGVVSSLVSALDIALWDIRGQALGRPVYELLGGPVREAVPLYTHPDGGDTPAGVAAACRAIVDTGHTALKTDPFPHAPGAPAHYLGGQLGPVEEQRGLDIVAAIREEVGPDIEILIDAHGRFDVPTAIRLSRRLEPYGIGWFEEPVPVESLHALRQVRDATSIPICVGERLYTRFEFAPILEAELAHYLMPDVTWTGGISELKKISTLAETYYVPVSPHDAGGPVNILASGHVMLTVPNCYRMETCRAKLNAYDAFIDTPLDIRDGQLYLPGRPGLGLTMNLEALRERAIAPWSGGPPR